VHATRSGNSSKHGSFGAAIFPQPISIRLYDEPHLDYKTLQPALNVLDISAKRVRNGDFTV